MSLKQTLFVAAIVGAIVWMHAYTARLSFTGDEPRYARVGVGLFSGNGLAPTPAAWRAFQLRSQLQPVPLTPAPGELPAQSLVPGLVFGPLLAFANLEAARWEDLGVGCAGLFFLTAMLVAAVANRNERLTASAAIATLAVAFSEPFFASLRTIYPEVLLFSFVSATLYAWLRSRMVAAAACAALLPLIHIRALPLSLAFIALIVSATIRTRGHATAAVLGTYVALISCWAALQFAVYGRLRGSAFFSHAPALATFCTRAGLQLFDVRHGLIAYAPIYLLGMAGLVAAAVRRDRAGTAAGILALVYFATFVWASAGESWTARYWIACLPFLAVGIAYWLRSVWAPAAATIALVLGSVSLANTILFTLQPMWFLENRTHSKTYEAIANTFHASMPAFLPVDSDGALGPVLNALPQLLEVTCAALVVLTALALARRLN